MTAASSTGRREPPAFRRLTVSRLQWLGPRLIRVTVDGGELAGFEIEQPAASIRLLIPAPGSTELVIPRWNGNEFLLDDGSRPVIRTFTPRDLTPRGLDLDIVIHPGGAVSSWVENAHPGSKAAVSGPGRGYGIDRATSGLVLVGDETAIPAISQLLEHVRRPADVHLAVHNGFGRVELPQESDVNVVWHELSDPGKMGEVMVAALRITELETKPIWCAGEAAAMQEVRTYLLEEMGIPRSRATVRGYWKARE